jgi:hypothetical protein
VTLTPIPTVGFYSMLAPRSHLGIFFVVMDRKSCRNLVCRDDIGDALECAICLDVYSDPRVLACGHSFCYACLMKLKCKKGTFIIKFLHFKTLPSYFVFFRFHCIPIGEKNHALEECPMCNHVLKPRENDATGTSYRFKIHFPILWVMIPNFHTY